MKSNLKLKNKVIAYFGYAMAKDETFENYFKRLNKMGKLSERALFEVLARVLDSVNELQEEK